MSNVAMARVRDLNAIDCARAHDLVDAAGKVELYTFQPRQYTEIPLALAARWLIGNKGFEVLGPDGQVLTLQTQGQETTGGNALVLRPDQVIAALDELTVESLLVRCNAKGENRLTRSSGKKAMVEFLMHRGPAPVANIDDTPADQPLGELAKAS